MKKFSITSHNIRRKPAEFRKKHGAILVSKNKNSKNLGSLKSKFFIFYKNVKYKIKNRKLYRRIWYGALIAAGVFFLFVLGVFAYFAKDLPSPNKVNARNVSESTKIYDRTGEVLLYEIHGEVKRTLITLDQASDYVKKATIAAEDKDFYKHSGFDLRGIIRSVFLNVQDENRVGGSTITQQFVKNSILTSEKTYVRKIKELILAIEIELKFSKDEILQMYLNEIPYGQNAYGIEAASETYFGKKAADLTLAESALLASLPRAPTRYSPFGNYQDELVVRKEWILDRMAEQKMISEEEAQRAKEEKLNFVESKEGIIAPHFVLYTKDQLVEKYGEKFVQEGGLKVYTTLDYNLQRMAEKAVAEGVGRNAAYNARNAALVAIDPKTGQILAMQGSKDYFDKENDGNVNVAIRDRQPGSSFKPYAYAAAFRKGYTPDTVLFDLETDFGGGYKPRNYNLSQSGPVTMRKALAGSLNIPAVKTLYLAGVDTTIDLAHEMGITTLNDRDRYGLSLVLGGGEIKLFDHVAAFGVFANDGVKVEKTPILKIVDREGKILENNEKREEKRVLDQQIVRQISSILSDNQSRSFVFGSRSPLILPNRPVAVKTGTTQEFRDAWAVGYTPSLAAGVWVGNNDNSEMKQGADGVYVAAPIWHSFMGEALRDKEIEDFQKPNPVATKKAILNGKLADEIKVTICKPSEKLATERCPQSMREERVYRRVHTILYYVDKDNPQGPYPSNPQKDPQFWRWEGPVRAWAERQGYKDSDPPKEYDNLHDAKNQPEIKIIEPESGAEITSSPQIIRVEVSAPLGIKKVEFYLGAALIGSDVSFPYQTSYDPLEVANGNHILTARVYDLVGTQSETNVGINVQISRPPSISLSSPKNDAVLTSADFSYPLSAFASTSSDLKSVKFYATDLNSDATEMVAEVLAQNKNQLEFKGSWPYPGEGEYQIYAIALNDEGKTGYTSKATVQVKK
jgi:1A family penicillin-binding protein